MARPPRRHGVVATALQGGRSQRGVVRRLLHSASALGGGAIDFLLRRPLRFIWRWILTRIGRRRCVAARRAKKNWRDDEPARGPLLRRTVARARGAIQAILVPGNRALAFLRDLPQRALAFALDLLQRLVPDFVRRKPSSRRPRPRQQPETLLPQPPPPTPTMKINFGAWIYGCPPPPHASPSPTPPLPPPPPTPPPPLIVGGEVVPDEVKKQYADYCKLASTCSPNKTICHFCFFEIQKSSKFTVRTSTMYNHCDKHHHEKPFIRCGKAGCNVRVCAGRDHAWHTYFCQSPSSFVEGAGRSILRQQVP